MNKNIKNEYAEMPDEFGKKIEEALKKVDEQKNRAGFSHTAKILIAVAAVLIVLSVSGFAADEIHKKFLNNENGKITLNIEKTTSEGNETKETEKSEEKYIKLNLGWLPEDIQPFEPPYKYHRVYSDGTESPGGLAFAIFPTHVAVQYVAENSNSAKEVMIGNHLGAILTFNEDKNLLIYFDEFNYVLLCYVTIDMEDAELIKIAENISLEETDKENAFVIDTCIPGSPESCSAPYDETPEEQIKIFEAFIEDVEKKYDILKSNGYDKEAEDYKNITIIPLKEAYSEYLKEPK